jgi:hypothetical protein
MDLPATRHSILEAVRSDDATVRRDGYGTMVAVYWKPVYKHLRLKWNLAEEEAKDATQDFFARAIEKSFSTPTIQARRGFEHFCVSVLIGFSPTNAKHRPG